MFFPHRNIPEPIVSIHRAAKGSGGTWICVYLAGVRVFMSPDEAVALAHQLADTVERFPRDKTHGQEQ